MKIADRLKVKVLAGGEDTYNFITSGTEERKIKSSSHGLCSKLLSSLNYMRTSLGNRRVERRGDRSKWSVGSIYIKNKTKEINNIKTSSARAVVKQTRIKRGPNSMK